MNFLKKKISPRSKKSNKPLFFVSKEKTHQKKDEFLKFQEFYEKKHLYTPYSKLNEIKLVNIGLASAEEIKKWAEKKLPNGKVLGQVTNANTLHHKTFKPLKGGLFCERIFGPTKDFECSCGKTKKMSSSKVALLTEEQTSKENVYGKTLENPEIFMEERERKFCSICDVEYTWSVIRRYQLGFIQLVMPVTHLWYLKGSPSYLSLLLDMKKKKLESVVYCSETMTLETLNSMIFSKSFPLFFSVFPEEIQEKNPLESNDPFLKATSSLYRSWEKILKKVESKKPLKSKIRSIRKETKISLFPFLKKKEKEKPKRFSGWRNMNRERLNLTREKGSVLKKPISRDVLIPLKVLRKFKDVRQKFHKSISCLTDLDLANDSIDEKEFYKIAHKKAHQILLKIQMEFLKKKIESKFNLDSNSFLTNASGKEKKNQNSLKFKEFLFHSVILSNLFSTNKKRKKQDNFLDLRNGLKRSSKENESKYLKFFKKSHSFFCLKKRLENPKDLDQKNQINGSFFKKGKLFFSKKMIKSILIFRIQKEILNSEFKEFFSSYLSNIKNLVMLTSKMSKRKNHKKAFKMTKIKTLNSILEKEKEKKKGILKNREKPSFFIREKKKTQEFLDSNFSPLRNFSKKDQHYSLYCLSHRFCWENEKDWFNFIYFFSAASKFDDVPISAYKKRISDTFQDSFSGVKVIQKLLTEFHFQELKKMDRQNRILLYELNKQIQKDSNFSKEKRKVQLNSKKSEERNSIPLEKKPWTNKRDQLIRRTKFIRKLFRKNSKPESMILSVLPVLPPDLRPILKIQDQIAASDLNRLYQRVIYRNERLKKFLKDSAMSHSYEMKYALRLLQEAVDNLLQNGKAGGTPERDSRGRLLKSLSEILKGKQGRFRQHLLGKRVDYSGRSVIVVGPQLKIHECGLPKEMALELFLPFLLKRLIHLKIARTVIGAKTLLKNHPNFTWEILSEVMQNFPILLNRAPTLHRLGIQAFQPKLIEGRAILLHPLVCPAFNADFDGDQMAVHIPLTVEARAEAWKLMCSGNHFFSPATGDPILLPSQDIVLGCYYLTTEKNQQPLKNFNVNKKFLNSFSQSNELKKDQKIWIRWDGFVENVEDPEQPLEIRINSFGDWIEIFSKFQYHFHANGRIQSQFLRTTPGRLFFHEIIQDCLFPNGF